MRMQAILSAVWVVGLLLVLEGASVESARHTWHAPQTMFVFGDSFVDNGNLPRTGPGDELSREWYYPYGVSYDDGSGVQPNATGRFSDFMVQSDFIAQMLGLPQSPPAYQTTENNYDPSGMNFAFGGTGVYRLGEEPMTLGEQVDVFKTMIDSGSISKNHATHSIALLAFSGHDYKGFLDVSSTDYGRNTGIIGNVTTEIAVNVGRLRDLGVKRVLVNNLHPLGCAPSQTRRNSYDACDKVGNMVASVHNADLKQKLGTKEGVFIVDLHTAFDNIIGQVHHDQAEGSELHNQFKRRRKPCCESVDPDGYCGQQGTNSKPLYNLCADPSKFFFWDDMHPTNAGWEAVLTQLQYPIKEFIGLI